MFNLLAIDGCCIVRDDRHYLLKDPVAGYSWALTGRDIDVRYRYYRKLKKDVCL